MRIQQPKSGPKASVDLGTDRVGKLFLVLKNGMRRCLVCEEVFTDPVAAKHSQIVCGLADPSTTLDEEAPAELSD